MQQKKTAQKNIKIMFINSVQKKREDEKDKIRDVEHSYKNQHVSAFYWKAKEVANDKGIEDRSKESSNTTKKEKHG